MGPKNSNKPAAPKSAKKGKAKQLGMGEGFERKKIAELEDAAEDYRIARDTWMGLQAEMTEKQVKLDGLLTKHGIKKYVYLDDEGDELEAYVPDTKPLAKVRRVKNAKAKADE